MEGVRKFIVGLWLSIASWWGSAPVASPTPVQPIPTPISEFVASASSTPTSSASAQNQVTPTPTKTPVAQKTASPPAYDLTLPYDRPRQTE